MRGGIRMGLTGRWDLSLMGKWGSGKGMALSMSTCEHVENGIFGEIDDFWMITVALRSFLPLRLYD